MTKLVKNARIIRIPEAEHRTGLSRTTILALEGKKLFPQRVRLTRGAFGYVEEEVDTWVAGRILLRDLPEAVARSDAILRADLPRTPRDDEPDDEPEPGGEPKPARQVAAARAEFERRMVG